MDQNESIARIRFVSSSNGALFALRLILLERPTASFLNGIYVEGTQYNKLMGTTIAMGFFPDSWERENAFYEAVRMKLTPSTVRLFMIVVRWAAPFVRRIRR